MNYEEFLATKFKFSKAYGFEISMDEINPMLHRHQPDIVQWAVRKGRAGIFAKFGLGKTFMQLEIMRILGIKDPGLYLIIAPLGVRTEFAKDAAKIGLEYKFVRRTEEITGTGLYLTNYESVRDGKLDPKLFNGVSLDEASILRGYGTKTYQEFLTLFADVPYRFVATATPSPNRYKELIHYAGFLGVMDTGQALTRFFQRDSTQANNLTLYPHMEREFHLWLHSWAVFIQRPSDLGCSDEGYELPELDVRWHEVTPKQLGGKVDRDGQIQLVNDAALGLKDAADEKRESIEIRVSKACEVVAQDPEDHFILWHDLEAERHAINAALPSAQDVYGSQDLEIREERILGFGEGEFQYLSTKPELAGSGCNFQRFCHRAIFVGITYSFNDFIQAVHRLQRFQQKHQVRIDIIYTETERGVRDELLRKWSEYDVLCDKMSDILRQYGLSTAGMEEELRRTIGVERRVETGEHFEVALNDCTDETRRMDENSIDLIHTSIPFGNHYEYTASYNDFGHNEDNGRFFQQMDYLTPELLRILRPGRIAAIHVKDRIRFGNVTGYGMPSVDPLSLAPGSHHPEVWHDVNRMLTLNGEQTQRGLANHICPLQFDIVDRIIRRYTNPGDTVFDPFGGLMTVPYRAIKLGRRGRASELNGEYFKDGVRYLREAERTVNVPTLFDLLEDEVSA